MSLKADQALRRHALIRKYLSLEHVLLLLTGTYLFVLPLPDIVSIREASFFLSLAIAVFLEFKSHKKVWPPLTVLMLLWLSISVLSTFASSDVWHSLSGVKKDVLYPVLAFWLLYTVSRGRKELKVYSAAIFASLLLTLAASYYSYYYLGLRYETLHFNGYLYGSKAFYVFILLSAVPLLIIFVLSGTKSTVLRIFCAGLIPATLVATYFARLRSGYLAVTVAAAVFLVYTNYIQKSIRRKVVLLTCLLVVALILPGMVMHRNLFVSANISYVTKVFSSLKKEERIVIWKEAVSEIYQEPLLGRGFRNNRITVVLENKLRDYPEVPTYTLDAHNLFLNYGLMTGVFGAAILFALFVKVFCLFHKSALTYLGNDRYRFSIALAGLLLLVVFVTINLTSDIMTRHCGQLFWALTGLLLGAVYRKEKNRNELLAKTDVSV